MTFKEHSAWIFRNGVPRLNLPANTTGVIVHIYQGAEAVEVELFGESGQTIAVQTFETKELRILGAEELVYPLDDGPLTDSQVDALRKDVAEHFPRGELISTEALFAERGRAAIVRSEAAGDWIPAETVIAKLEAKVGAAHERQMRRRVEVGKDDCND